MNLTIRFMFKLAVSQLDCFSLLVNIKLCRETAGLEELQSHTSPPVLLLAGSSDGTCSQHRPRFNHSTFSVIRRLVPETVGLLFVGNCDRPFATMKVKYVLSLSLSNHKAMKNFDRDAATVSL